MESQLNNQQNNESAEKPVMNVFENTGGSIFTPKLFIVLFIIVLLGIGSGYLLSKKGTAQQNNAVKTSVGSLRKTVVGSNDTKTFKDTAEGIAKIGGIDGEGAFHLLRPGGASQNVYMTSSVVDLSSFIGKKIRVWGETQSAKHAGWLMDVGRVEVLQ